MRQFISTSHLSEILQKSDDAPVIIFKFSKTCMSSSILEEKLISEKLKHHVFKVVVQDTPELSRKIEDFFEIKHESPQIIIVNKGKVTYSANHHHINIKDFLYS